MDLTVKGEAGKVEGENARFTADLSHHTGKQRGACGAQPVKNQSSRFGGGRRSDQANEGFRFKIRTIYPEK